MSDKKKLNTKPKIVFNLVEGVFMILIGLGIIYIMGALPS